MKGFKCVEGLDCRYLINKKGDCLSLIGPSGLRKEPSRVSWRENDDGYLCSTFVTDSSRHKVSAHRLVASGFLGLSLFDRSKVVHHIDNNKRNNCVENLLVTTKSENTRFASRDGLMRKKFIFSDYQKERLKLGLGVSNEFKAFKARRKAKP